MHRTQVHLDERHVRALERASRETGASRAELIRRAIERVYDGGERRLPRSLGIVSDGRFDAATIKQRVRDEWLDDLRLERERSAG